MSHVGSADTPPHLPRATAALSRDIDDELASHLAMLRDDLVASGWSEEAAEAEALRRFGDPNAVRDVCIAISRGVTPMWMRISVAFNVLFALLLLGGIALYVRSAQLSRDARAATLESMNIAAQSSAAALRKAIWNTDHGTVRIEGKVNRPGEYPTSLDSPRSLAELLDDAGGLAADATLITVRRAKFGREESRSVESLHTTPRQPADVDPGPDDVVVVQ